MRHQRASPATVHGSPEWHPLPSIGSFQGEQYRHLGFLYHSRPVLIRYISIFGYPKRCLETLIKSTTGFTSKLVHLLDILLYCALVVRCQRVRAQALQYFRDQVGHFFQAFQPGFDASTPGLDIMLPVNPEYHLETIPEWGLTGGIFSKRGNSCFRGQPRCIRLSKKHNSQFPRWNSLQFECAATTHSR